ncbi:thioredoxin-disulfide reductase [Sphingobacterium sp. Ag1]|uniref:thioredoxin-disulfide reductase n=1 Tax=Sphingobacterium sp. Ag1 TaxID=1643451 RepID=UPI000A07BF82|nr:thioredoxin-disulfide reductase [Sphingobacterium sp. Ag1]
MNTTKCLIIGSGPAGYTAAIYASRSGLNPLLFTGVQVGGQLTETTDVDNFPGYSDGVQGPAMMDDLRRQAERFGTEIVNEVITDIDFSDRPFRAITESKKEFLAETLIIATGASAKWLGLPSETKYNGRGVSACATCDGFFYRGKEVVVVGGGDTAMEEAVFLANIVEKVYLLVRKNTFRASLIMQKRVQNISNIEVLFNTELKDILGDESGVNAAKIYNNISKKEAQLNVSGVFIAIGHTPNTQLFAQDILLDETGYIKTISASSKTNISGVFACGDVQDNEYRQAVTAAGSGCMAAIDAERFLSSRIQKNGITCVDSPLQISTIITKNGMRCIEDSLIISEIN